MNPEKIARVLVKNIESSNDKGPSITLLGSMLDFYLSLQNLKRNDIEMYLLALEGFGFLLDQILAINKKIYPELMNKFNDTEGIKYTP